jgi:hypothetical protein
MRKPAHTAGAERHADKLSFVLHHVSSDPF